MQESVFKFFSMRPITCGCGGEPKINYIAPYYHLRPEWEVQVCCPECNTQTDWYRDEDKRNAEAKAVKAWNIALSGIK